MNFVAVARRDAGLVREASRGQLLAIARAVFGGRARLLAHHRLHGGHFNTSYLLQCAHEAPVVLRLAPEPGAGLWRHELDMLQRQCAVQPMFEAACSVVPRLVHADFTRRLLSCDWAMFEWRAGRTWDSVATSIDATASCALWREYGRIVRAIHGQRCPHFGYPDPGAAASSFGAWFARQVDDLAADLHEQGVEVAGLAWFRTRLRDECHRFDAIDVPRLVHGDLWTRNVLVDRGPQGWRISALLDAERAFFGDPAAEWIFGFLEIPQGFWDGYGRSLAEHSIDRDALWRRRAYQARGALFMMLEGARFGFDAGFAHRQFARACAAMESGAAAGSGTTRQFDALPGPRKNYRSWPAMGITDHA